VADILLVDDEEDILELFRIVLESRGFHADTAASAAEAIRKVGEKNYSLCLLDVNLPDMPGPDLLMEMHRIRPGMKVIIVTGDTRFSGTDAVKIGASGFVLKPLNRALLISTVEEALNGI
jgi:two-component system, NtrC family, response regulator PilR